MKYPDTRVLLFCKTPILGEVKTRLEPALGQAGTLLLHVELATRMIECIEAAHLAPLEVWTLPRGDHPFFDETICAESTTLHVQRGADLGERMDHAVQDALARGAAKVLVIGIDCPGLDAAHLDAAMADLAAHDAVLTPVEDGGYVLLGLKVAAPTLFSDMRWSTDTVAADTRTRMQALGWQWAEQPELWDLDRPEDLDRYYALQAGGRTAAAS